MSPPVVGNPVATTSPSLTVKGGVDLPQEAHRPALRRAADPRRSRDDHHPVPYQLALATQRLLGLLLGDEPFDLTDAAPDLATVAQWTAAGHEHSDRFVWDRTAVLARIAELVATYNPPPELGGDPPVAEPDGVEELAGAR